MSPEHNVPLSIVIFGATGDLAKKKLLPALLDLSCAGLLPDDVRFVGMARQEMSDEEFRALVREAIDARAHEHPAEQVREYLARVTYVSGDFTEERTYHHLVEYLAQLDRTRGVCTNKLLYLSVSPALYETIFEHAAASGLERTCAAENWVRIAVEKPFGRDSRTARALDEKLASLFSEEQIFRIDHYLAKEALQNILTFRFSNVLFEPVWSSPYIDRIEIDFHESFGVGSRGAFYEDIGALRDVGQNHVLQMLALVALENPGSYSAEAIRRAREEVLSYVRLAEGSEPEKGQYRSYREEYAVAEDSTTETYFKLQLAIDTERWRGVPFILSGGKMLGEDRIEIRVFCKESATCVCHNEEELGTRQNVVRFTMVPTEEIGVTLWAKQRGFSMDIEEQQVTIAYEKSTGRTRDAYEKILLDVIRGDQTLFTTSREVAAAWDLITPISEGWQGREPFIYDDGWVPRG
jgi:glucose-6-phosphate 1-dehydrogenase